MQAARKIAKTPSQPLRSFKVIENRRYGKFSSPFVNFLLFSFILALFVMLNLSQRALIAQYALQMEKLKTTLHVEQIKNEKLLLQAMELKSPERIRKIACEELGMISPTEVSYITLPPEMNLQGGREPFARGSPPSKESAILGRLCKLAGRLEKFLRSPEAEAKN